MSQGYGFVEMKSKDEARRVLRRTTDATLKGYNLFMDYECSRTMKGWKPRRLGITRVYIVVCILISSLYNIELLSILGGGFGGKKESGQLRFGGKDRPFKRPIVPHIMKPNR